MKPRLAWMVSVVLGSATSAWAEGEIIFEDAAPAEEEAAAVEQSAPPAEMAEQLLGATLGFEGGGRVSPGGLKLGGSHLYQLTDRDWLRSSLAITFGGGSSDCSPSELGAMNCNHDMVSGQALSLGASIRRFFEPINGITPYGELGVNLKFVSFSDDDVRGVGLPVAFSVGGRKEVQDGVAVFAQTLVEAGLGYFNQGLGWEPQVTLGLSAGVEFDLP